MVEMFIKFKWMDIDDPFCDCYETESGHQSFIRETKTAFDTLGQITSYSAAQFGAQFRTHIYSVLIVRGTARLLRWDRSGTIVTDVIKYNDCDILAEFFYRYSKAPDAMRGKDESVLDPSLHHSQRKLRPDKPCSYRSWSRLSSFQSLMHLVSLLCHVCPSSNATYTPRARNPRLQGL